MEDKTVTQEELDRIPNYQPEFGANTFATTDADFYEAVYQNSVKVLVGENSEITEGDLPSLEFLPVNDGLEKAYIRELLSLEEMIEIVSKDPDNEHYEKALDCILESNFIYTNPNHEIIPALMKRIDQTYPKSFDSLSDFIIKNPSTKHLDMVLDLIIKYEEKAVIFFTELEPINRSLGLLLFNKLKKSEDTIDKYYK